MSDERFISVWDAIEDTPGQAENMKLRSALMMALKDHMTRAGLNQSQAARLFGVTQPRVSDLMRGKIDLFGLDTLVSMAAGVGLHVEMWVRKAAAGTPRLVAPPQDRQRNECPNPGPRGGKQHIDPVLRVVDHRV